MGKKVYKAVIAKPKTYQVVITIEKKVLFDATNDKAVVDEWLNAVDTSASPVNVQVYKFTDTCYELVAEKAKVKPSNEYRPVGFCRGW